MNRVVYLEVAGQPVYLEVAGQCTGSSGTVYWK